MPQQGDNQEELLKNYSKSKDLYNLINDDSVDELPAGVKDAIGRGGKKLGKYVILEQLGRGGSGTVYKAFDTSLKRFVALKIISVVSAEQEERFRREAESLASLKHPNIVPVYEVGAVEGKSYIAMQFIEGETLDALSGELTEQDCLRVVMGICDAMGAAHEKGIIHRDLKPQNVIIDSNAKVFVVDFGLAKQYGGGETMTRDIIGTPHFMSPEQVTKTNIDFRTDVYSIGAMLYSCITGEPPFEGRSAIEVVTKVIEAEPIDPKTLRPDLDDDLNVIIKKCLSKDPDMRYQGVGELRKDIERYVKGVPISARDHSFIYTASKFTKRNRAYLVGLLIAIVFIIALPMLFDLRGAPAPYPPKDPYAARRDALPFYERALSNINILNTATDEESRARYGEYIRGAITQLSEAIAVYPTFSEAYMARGSVYLMQEQYRQAADEFASAMEYTPNLSEAYYMRIVSRMMLLLFGEVDKEEFKSRYVKEMAGDLKRLKELNVLPAKIDCAASIVILAALNTGHGRRQIEKMTGGYNTDVVPLLVESLKADPTLSYGHLFFAVVNLSKVSTSAGEERNEFKQKARIQLEKFITLEPNVFRAHYLLTDLYGRDQMVDQAAKHAKIIQLLRPENPIGYIVEGLAVVREEREAAKLLLERSGREVTGLLLTRQDTLDLYTERGKLKLWLGLDEEAMKDFNMAMEALKSREQRDWLTRQIETIKRLRDEK